MNTWKLAVLIPLVILGLVVFPISYLVLFVAMIGDDEPHDMDDWGLVLAIYFGGLLFWGAGWQVLHGVQAGAI